MEGRDMGIAWTTILRLRVLWSSLLLNRAVERQTEQTVIRTWHHLALPRHLSASWEMQIFFMSILRSTDVTSFIFSALRYILARFLWILDTQQRHRWMTTDNYDLAESRTHAARLALIRINSFVLLVAVSQPCQRQSKSAWKFTQLGHRIVRFPIL